MEGNKKKNNKMNIDEVKKEKRIVEARINKLLNDFQDKSKLNINEIHMKQFDVRTLSDTKDIPTLKSITITINL